MRIDEVIRRIRQQRIIRAGFEQAYIQIGVFTDSSRDGASSSPANNQHIKVIFLHLPLALNRKPG